MKCEDLNRRTALKSLGLGAGLTALGFVDHGAQAAEAATTQAKKGSKPITITKVRAITCATHGTIRFVVIRVDTSRSRVSTDSAAALTTNDRSRSLPP